MPQHRAGSYRSLSELLSQVVVGRSFCLRESASIKSQMSYCCACVPDILSLNLYDCLLFQGWLNQCICESVSRVNMKSKDYFDGLAMHGCFVHCHSFLSDLGQTNKQLMHTVLLAWCVPYAACRRQWHDDVLSKFATHRSCCWYINDHWHRLSSNHEYMCLQGVALINMKMYLWHCIPQTIMMQYD